MKSLTVERSSFYGTVIPLLIVVAASTAILIGVVIAALGVNWSRVLIVCGVVGVFVGVAPFYTQVRRVTWNEDGTVSFFYSRREVNCQLAEVTVLSTVAPNATSNWPVRFQTPARVVRVCPQLTGIEDLIKAVRATNP